MRADVGKERPPGDRGELRRFGDIGGGGARQEDGAGRKAQRESAESRNDPGGLRVAEKRGYELKVRMNYA